jgi:hypothetical protein
MRKVVAQRPIESTSVQRRFVSARELSVLIGRSEKTLERDRTLRKGFPHFKILGQVRYDVDEVLRLIAATRVEPERS